MRKFAKSIGSEGKSRQNRGGKCHLETAVLIGLCRVSALCTLNATDLSAWRLPFRGVGIPYSSCGTLLAASVAKAKIANSELLTAENPTV